MYYLNCIIIVHWCIMMLIAWFYTSCPLRLPVPWYKISQMKSQSIQQRNLLCRWTSWTCFLNYRSDWIKFQIIFFRLIDFTLCILEPPQLLYICLVSAVGFALIYVEVIFYPPVWQDFAFLFFYTNFSSYSLKIIYTNIISSSIFHVHNAKLSSLCVRAVFPNINKKFRCNYILQ